MSSIDWAGVILAVISFIGWVVSLEMRLRNVQSKLIVSEQKVSDAATVVAVHNFTDAALSLAVANDIGPSSTGPDSGAIPAKAVDLLSEQSATGKN